MKTEIKLGPLIEGTMRPIDVIPAMLNECFRRGISYGAIINATSEQWPDQEIQMGRALRVVTNGIGSPRAVVAIPDHKWWNEDLDNGQGWTNHEENQQVWQELVDLLNEDLAGAAFDTHPDDPACLGYWAEPNEDTRGEGIYFMWERTHPGLKMMRRPPLAKDDDVFFQDEDMHRFLMEIGAVDFVWMNDPQNTEGRVFKTIEEHYDAIMEPYFGTIKHMEPRQAFDTFYNGKPNPMTPHALIYTKLKASSRSVFHFELSKGRGLYGKDLHAVTVLREENGRILAVKERSGPISSSSDPITDEQAAERLMDIISEMTQS